MDESNTRPSPPNGDQQEPERYLDAFERLQVQFQNNLTALSDQLDRWSDHLAASSHLAPAADILETDDAYLVEIELAGVKRNDIDVTTTGRTLTVSGERREKERAGILRRRNRTVGTFRYEIDLPGHIEPDDVEAGLEHGVLTVKLPKPPAERARRIEIG